MFKTSYGFLIISSNRVPPSGEYDEVPPTTTLWTFLKISIKVNSPIPLTEDLPLLRISDPLRKVSVRKMFQILFWLETSKHYHSRRGSGVTNALAPPCPSTSQKIYFHSQNCPFIF